MPRVLPELPPAARNAALVGGVVAGCLVLFFSDDAVEDESTEIPTGQQSLSVEQTSAIADAAARARPSTS